jgi:hypothetical protein
MGGVVPFLHVGGGDHDVEFLLELGGLGSLTIVISGHWGWWRGTPRGGVVHRKCSRRRQGGKLLGFERSGSEKNLGSDYHVEERRAAEYWMPCIKGIDTYL